MTWAGARAVIKTTLEGLAITSPSASIKRCYEYPPGTVQDWPAFIIYPPSVDVVLSMGDRVRNYRPRLLLIISDQDMSQAAAIADAFREVLIPAFDNKVSLSGSVHECWVDRCDEVAKFDIGGKWLLGFDSFLHIEIKEPFNPTI